MSEHSSKERDAAAQAARHNLQKLGDGESVFTGSIDATVKRATTHFSGRDDPADDSVEIWGKRIGRALSLAAVVALGVYLYLTYVK